MHSIAVQAGASALQQELQGLRFSAAQAEKQLQVDITSLQGQLATALSASDQEIRQMNALKDQLKVAAADSDRRLSIMKGELKTAQAECAKASQVEGRLETALKNSRNSHQQREAAFKARRAAEVRPSPATLTFSGLAVNQLLCPCLRLCMMLCGKLCSPFTKLRYVAKLPWGFLVALLCLLMHKLPLVQLAPLPVLFSDLLRLQALLPHSCSCHTLALLVCNSSWLDSGRRKEAGCGIESGRSRLDSW